MSADIPEILARVEAALARAEARILDSCGLHEWDLYPEVTFGDLRRMVAALKWRPIETAPHDEPVIVAEPSKTAWAVGEARWIETEHGGEWRWSNDIPGWEYADVGAAHPTHWLPMPQPPV